MMRQQLSRTTRLGISIAMFAVFAATLLYVITTASAAEGKRFTATYGRAGQGLTTSSPVKIRGVTVGNVRSVELDTQGRALVSFVVRDDVEVPRSVTASVEPLSIFGPKFINLIPGDGDGVGPYLADGATITRTSDPRDLTDTLGESFKAVDAIDPTEVSVIMHTLGQATDGQGPRLRKLVDNSATIINILDKHRGSQYQVLGSLAKFRGTPGNSTDDFVGTAGDLNVWIPAVDAKGDQIRTLLDQTTLVTSTSTGGLKRHWGDIAQGFRSGERASGVLYAQLGVIGDGVRGVNHILDVLTDSARIPGPGGTALLGTEAFISLNPCELIVDLCPSVGR